MIHVGDCVQVMAGMAADSVDAVVTDPPYGLEFMGRAWDRLGDIGKTSHGGVIDDPRTNVFGRVGKIAYSGSANKKCRRCNKWAWDHEGRKCECEVPDFPNVEGHQARLMQEWHYAWATEALRVTKPGGYLLAFGGTRTHHRLVCGLEDAGWIIRDELDWIYASGFPKGRANLKPAHEPIVLARKPGPLRPLNIEETRIGTESTRRTAGEVTPEQYGSVRQRASSFAKAGEYGSESGRWPSNVLLGDAELFDSPNPYVVGSGAVTTTSQPGTTAYVPKFDGEVYNASTTPQKEWGYGDIGGYSRFFIIPKADRADREPVLRGQLAEQERRTLGGGSTGVSGDRSGRGGKAEALEMGNAKRENSHATVKPTDLMRHLIRLVTPPGGTVLDPFLGSGSTAIAAELEGFPWIGIEKEPEYVAIAEARLNGTQRGLGLDIELRGKPQTGQSGWRDKDRPDGAEGVVNSFGAGSVTGRHYDDGPRPPKRTRPQADTLPVFDEEPAA